MLEEGEVAGSEGCGIHTGTSRAPSVRLISTPAHRPMATGRRLGEGEVMLCGVQMIRSGAGNGFPRDAMGKLEALAGRVGRMAAGLHEAECGQSVINALLSMGSSVGDLGT